MTERSVSLPERPQPAGALPDKRQVAASFSRAASSYDSVAELQRVIGAELSMNPSRVALMAAELLGEARGASTARIFGCREDIEELRRTFASLGFSGGTATFEEDPSLLRGSLVVESDVGTVDGRLETRLPRFADALLEALRHG